MNNKDDEPVDREDDLRDHYAFDYGKAKPNRFAERLTDAALVVVIEPDIAAAFQTPEAINEALRLIMRLAAIPRGKPQQRRKRKAATT